MTADTEMTLEELTTHFRTERRKLNSLRAPALQMTEGSDADMEFRIKSGVAYALDYIDVLLNRMKALEGRLADLESR